MMLPLLHNIISRLFSSGEFEKTIDDSTATKVDPLFDYFTREIPDALLSIVGDKYTADGSIGKGNRLYSYWFAIFDKRITNSAARGVYVVYLLSHDGERLYLALNQGSDSESDIGLTELRRRAAFYSKEIKNVGNFRTGKINIGLNPLGRAKKFAEGSIFFKEYNKRDPIPEETSLRNDLNLMLESYEDYVSKKISGSFTEMSEVTDDLVSSKEEKKGEVEMAGQIGTSQKIFFGAPGTGKSHKIDAPKDEGGLGLKVVPEDRKFRTTFHPDYDYAQFVGSYKPVSRNTLYLNQTKEPLAELAKKFDGGDFPLYKFSAVYSEFLENLNIQEKMDVVKDSPLGIKKDGSVKDQSTFSIEMNAGVSIGNFLKKEFRSSEISYSFVPQVFAKAYVAAYKNPDKPVYLVVEEINRGNCAQIFGDIFQLLDRDENGFSSYEIEADADFGEWLEKELKDCEIPGQAGNDIKQGKKLKLPPNFNILATMNTSDQSLFPMDSAFKRRFDWEYVPINYEHEKAKFAIEIGDKKYDWLDFLEKVNEDIYDVTESEDKQMGEFFVKPKEGESIDVDTFLSKVMFYLWDSVYKDEPERKNVFHFEWEFGDKKRTVTFQRLFKDKDVTIKILQHMMDENLKVNLVPAE